MNSSCNSLLDSASQHKASSCESHVAQYYEQNQEEEITQHHPIDSPLSSAEKIPSIPSPPVEIHDETTTNIELPPLSWHGYHLRTKTLTVTNTGQTIIINGCWTNSRPYIEGGPLNGSYLFSQIHFHCPSEHEIDGKRYPLEMHIVHYKTSYLTQERAMNERDGTVVLVYLFKYLDKNETALSQITKLAPQLGNVNSPLEINGVSLFDFIKPFNSNYYVYWGSVTTKMKRYVLQWIISCSILGVSKKEVQDLSDIITSAIGARNIKHTPRVKPENDAVYRVGEEDFGDLLSENVCSICKLHEDRSRVLLCGSSGTDVSCKTLKGSHFCRKCKSIESSCSKCSEQRKGSRFCRKCKSIESSCSKCSEPRKGSRFCRKCKSIDSSCSKCSESRKGKSSRHSRRSGSSGKKSKKKSKVCSDPHANGSDDTAMLSSESASGSSVSSCEEKRKKKKKCKHKKKRSKKHKTCDCESKKSSSKSSASEDKSQKKAENSSDSECTLNSELKIIAEVKEKPKRHRKKKGKKHRPESQSESEGETEKQVSDGPQEVHEKKKLKKKKEVAIVGLLEVSPSNQNLKTNTDVSCPTPTSDDLLSLSTKPSAHNVEAEEEKKTNSEEKIATKNESLGSRSTECLDEEKTKSKAFEIAVPGLSKTAQTDRSRSKSRTNMKKVKAPESPESPVKKIEIMRRSKSKSPVDNVPNKKGSLRRDNERSGRSSSKSKVSIRESSQNKTGKNKKDSDFITSQSAQEVKGQIEKSTALIESLKCDPKSPGDKEISKDKLPDIDSFKLEMSKSKELRKLKSKAKNSGQKSKEDNKDGIKTLFEKKQNRKIESLAGDCNDVQINFLLTPNSNIKNIPSYVLTTSESDFTDTKKDCDINRNQSSFLKDLTVSTVTFPASEFPKNTLKESSQVCLLMEHVLRTENKGQVWKCSSQEYNVAVIFDQNVMQEYKGKFHPQKLQQGNHEELQLVPRYPEPENFRLQDCSIKMDSDDQICISVKFLLKELSITQIFPKTENGLKENSSKKKLLMDEETQCSTKEFDLAGNPGCSKFSEKHDISTIGVNDVSISRSQNIEKQNKPLKLLNGEKEAEKSEKSTLKMSNDLDIYLQNISQYSVNEETAAELNLNKKVKIKTTCSAQNDKKLKPLFIKRKKTVYFMYDKVEKDESTGKKVFVGSFRTKEEMIDFKKQKLLQETEGRGKSNEIFNPQKPKSRGNLEIIKLESSPKSNISGKNSPPDEKSPPCAQGSSPGRTQDLITLHKYRPKYPEISSIKQDGKNIFIGKITNKGLKDNETLNNSPETEKAPQISIHQLQDATEPEPEKEKENPHGEDIKSKAANIIQPEDRNDRPSPEVIVPEKSNEAEKDSTNTQESSSKNESQTALLPVEAENLRKLNHDDSPN